MNEEVYLRFTAPSRFDNAPEGTVVKVQHDEHYDYYINISEYKDLPNWIKWGDFLGLILKEEALNKDFATKCLNIFKNKDIKEKENLLNGI